LCCEVIAGLGVLVWCVGGWEGDRTLVRWGCFWKDRAWGFWGLVYRLFFFPVYLVAIDPPASQPERVHRVMSTCEDIRGSQSVCFVSLTRRVAVWRSYGWLHAFVGDGKRGFCD